MSNTPDLQQVYWHDVRAKVAELRPQLAHIIDQLSPDQNLPLIEARYPYGSKIIDNGRLMLPGEDAEIHALDSNMFPTDLQEKLGYSTTPICFVLNKNVEIFTATPHGRIVPYRLCKPGVCIGMWESLEKLQKIGINHAWFTNVTAGARSVFMLPKVTDSSCYERLRKRYQTQRYVPQSLNEHWHIFSQITHSQQDQPWQSEVLFFTKHWLEKLDDLSWYPLRCYWQEESIEQYQHWCNKFIFELAWEQFNNILEERKIKLKTYKLDTMKQLISIGMGIMPGFRPTDGRDTALPTACIQNAYVDVYGLKQHAPIIIQPWHLDPSDPKDQHAVYYSLQHPSLPESPPLYKHPPSIMKEMHELADIMDAFFEVLHNTPKTTPTSEHDFADVVKYQYFHNQHDSYGTVQHSMKLATDDPGFLKMSQTATNHSFPENSPFLQGCIQVRLEL